jgi:hypothetical protein
MSRKDTTLLFAIAYGVAGCLQVAGSRQQTVSKRSVLNGRPLHRDYNAPAGPQAPRAPSLVISCARYIVRGKRESGQYSLRIDDGSGLLRKGGILNVDPA